MGEIRITMPMGIGDCYWVLQKMAAFHEYVGKQHRLIACIAHGDNHKTAPFLRATGFFHSVIEDKRALRGVPEFHRDPKWSTVEGSAGWRGYDFCLQANGHLESGKRIETWLPELATEYVVRCELPELGPDLKEPRVLLYPSGRGPNSGFNTGWGPAQWQAILTILNAHNIRPTFVGAATNDDVSYWQDLQLVGSFESLVGQTTLEQYLALIHNCRAWFGLNSGGGIVAGAWRKKTFMLWSDSRFDGKLCPEMATSWMPLDQDWYQWFPYGEPGMEDRALRALLEAL